MKNKDSFSNFHPFVSALFFVLVLGMTMFLPHPGIQMFSLAGALCFYRRLKGGRSLGRLLLVLIPLLAFTVIINPAFNHEGLTELFFLPSGNVVTLESLLYGFGAGVMVCASLVWFACFHAVFTADKLMYLFGRLLPAISLIISMTLRFVPDFYRRFELTKETQSALGYDTEYGGFARRIRNGIRCFSIVTTWSLENAIETADSMKSRGYGTGRRTSFHTYRLEEKDRELLVGLLCAAFFFLSSGIGGKLDWRYFPSVRGKMTEPITIAAILVFGLICFLPIIVDRREEREWKRSE